MTKEQALQPKRKRRRERNPKKTRMSLEMMSNKTLLSRRRNTTRRRMNLEMTRKETLLSRRRRKRRSIRKSLTRQKWRWN